MSGSDGPLRVGMAGLGAAARQILPVLADTPGIELTAVADVRGDALGMAAQRFPGVKIFDDVEAMAAARDVDALWIATPNEFHATHAIAALGHGKHVIGEKPMALSVTECTAMVDAVAESGAKYVQGHSKLHETAIREMGILVAGGELGQVVQVVSLNSNDWLRRPRLANELETASGGGIVYRQGPHQVDIVRFLGGGLVTGVVGRVGQRAAWCSADGDYAALFDFESGALATLSLNGYGDFDASELTWDIGEGGRRQTPAADRAATAVPMGAVSAEEKYAWADATRHDDERGPDQPFFGLTIVICENGVLRQSPEGIYAYRDGVRIEVPIPRPLGRRAELLELQRCLAEDDDPFPGPEWGRATVAVCLAILEASDGGQRIVPQCQVRLPMHVAVHSESPGQERAVL